MSKSTRSQALRYKTLKRDDYSCRKCGYNRKLILLEVHHIDEDRNNNGEDNLITLCKFCHILSPFKGESFFEWLGSPLVILNRSRKKFNDIFKNRKEYYLLLENRFITINDWKTIKEGKGLPCIHAPFGYKYNKKGGKWSVVKKKAEIVRRVFEMVIEGKTMTEICKALDIDKGVYYRIVKNKSYCGYVHYFIKNKDSSGKVISKEEVCYKGNHKLIISEEIFEKTKKIRNMDKVQKKINQKI